MTERITIIVFFFITVYYFYRYNFFITLNARMFLKNASSLSKFSRVYSFYPCNVLRGH